MSLQFLTGNSGSGKSRALYQSIIGASTENPDGRFLVIVPEQFTMQTQKELVSLHPQKGILNIDVLSFQRLAYRIFEEVGADKRTILDETGKNLLLRKAAIQKKSELQVLGGNLNKTGYISEMKSVISELTQYDMTPEKMDEMMAAAKNKPQLYYKLEDIGILYREFRNMLKEKYVTADELLEILCLVADKSDILKGCVLAFDGFTGFTPIQLKLMRKLMVLAREVLVTVTLDAKENPSRMYGEHELFYLSKKTIHGLTKIAREEHITLKEPQVFGREGSYRFQNAPVLGFLEQNLFRFGRENRRFELGVNEISIHMTKDPQDEAHYIARTICSLTLEENMRYQDIAVICGDMASYSSYIQRVFKEYGIPCFIDETKTILLNPFIEFIRAALEAVQNNYSYESMFRLLRTGLCSLVKEEIDLLENYVLAAGIRGMKKWRGKWEHTTKANSEEILAECVILKEAFLEHLDPFTGVMKDKKANVREWTISLYELIVSFDIQQKLKDYEIQFEAQGRMDLAREYSQIYEIVINLLEKLVELLGNECLSLKEYQELLEAGFEEAKVGIIPPAADQVLVGDIERTRLKEIKVLFFAGLNDGWVPKNGSKGGILSDLDRQELKEGKIELAPTARENMYTQKFYLYLNLTKPSRYLYLSCSKIDSGGKTLRPSYMIHTIMQIFPQISIIDEENYDSILKRAASPISGLSYLVEGLSQLGTGKISEEWFTLFDWYSKREEFQEPLLSLIEAAFYVREDVGLPKAIAASLYGSILENSVTRLESFAACAFSHFLKYGLVLSERETYEFKPMDMGNIFHTVVELFSRKVERSGFGWFALTDEVRDELIEETVEEVVADYGDRILYSTARNEYAIMRMKRIMRRTIWALHEQIKSGSFLPSNYEVSFSMTGDLDAVNIALSKDEVMKLKGRIDRVDVEEKEDQVYVKVIDYKSGNTSFDLVALYYGLQLQLVVYLNAALELEKRIHPDKEMIPAGIFYYHMKDPMLDREPMDTPESVNERLLKKLRLDGLVNGDSEVLKSLDKNMEKDSKVIPVNLNKDGSPSKNSNVATKEQFEQLSEFVNNKMKEIGRKILDGQTQAIPYERKDKTACEYCIYKEVCGFDEKIPGNRYHRIKEWKPEEIWQKLKKEEDRKDEMDRGTTEGH